MNASIAEPFLLSSYSGKGARRAAAHDDSEGSLPPIFARHGQASSSKSSSDGYVTVAAQGDGLHVLDVTTLHPAASHTLGPGTSFAAPAVTHDGTTFAVVNAAPGVESSDSGRIVWSWKENLLGELQREAPKRSTLVPHDVADILVHDALPSSIILVSSSGAVTVASTEMEFGDTFTPPASTSKRALLKSFIFARRACTFVSAHNLSGDSVVVITISGVGKKRVYVQAVLIGIDGSVQGLGESQSLGNEKDGITPKDVVDFSCSKEGYLTALTRTGHWHSFRLQSSSSSLAISRPSENTLQLRNISFAASSPSLLSLGSSHILLAALTSTTAPELALLLWDLQYAVVLASHTIPLPSTLPTPSSSANTHINLSLLAATPSQSLLLLSPATPKPSSKHRSSILIVPHTVPATSTIANALGRAASAEKWLASSDSTPEKTDAGRNKVVADVRSAIAANKPQLASTAFFEWVRAEKAHSNAEPALSSPFVRDLLAAILPASTPRSIPCTAIMQYLLEKDLVSSTMVDGGLLNALLTRNDWKSINLALSHVVDLPESDLAVLLKTVVARHRQTPSDDMQVDTPSATSETPSLPTFLSKFIARATEPAALRSALRKHLNDAEDAVSVMEVVDCWMSDYAAQDIVGLDLAPQESDLPPLPKILLFLQTLLDTSFLSLLQYTPSHELLRRITGHLAPELALIETLETLRGPLEPFAIAQSRSLADGKKGKDEGKDWRKKRAQAREQVGLAVGVYRLEELVF
ncbi:hypothetical protein PLICRDRAFT_47642 [Plicaturopsis crispa FD-325 SS-3]|nr:hypothetical protein PLICRDRAFT_47642 [Plicaturopsis crispa FD-325 SS-3]